MKGILLNTVELAGKRYTFNDVTKGVLECPFPADKFYGGRVKRFGKTADGLHLCLEQGLENVIDIFIDFDSLHDMRVSTLRQIADKVKAKKFAVTPVKDREQMSAVLEIKKDATKEELIEYILTNAVDVI
jgi:hypothetical protein